MASITSLMNSSYNTSSIYGNRNVLSGLASGLDTESMIENAVSGIKTKIQNLLQKRTKIEWQQEAYRSIIDKAVNLGNKYTSYSSKTNLLSSSFFNNAVITSAQGTYADKLTASGKTTSDIKINAVKQLATAASYSVSGNAAFGGDFSAITGGAGVDLTKRMGVSNISGSLTLQYGGSNGTSFNLNFEELDVYDNANDLVNAIREKLGEQTWTYSKNGVQETVKGSDVISVRVDSKGNIKFSDRTGDGNSVYISSASGDIKNTLGVSTGSGADTIATGGAYLSRSVTTGNYLFDKSLTFNLNGTSKTIEMSDLLSKVDSSADEDINTQFVNALQDELNNAFGKGKVEVSRDKDGMMSFHAAQDGSTLTLSGSAAKALGFESGDANYVNTGKTLKDLLGERDSYDFKINGVTIRADGDTTLESLMSSINSNADAGVKVSYSKLTNEFKFTATETGSNSRIEFDGLAREVFGASGNDDDRFAERFGIDLGKDGTKFVNFTVGNGEIGFSVTKDMTMGDVIKELNDNPFGYKASYNELSGQIVMTDADGKALDYKVSVADSIDSPFEEYKAVNYRPSASYTAGTDAVMDVEVNGVRFENLARSSNNFEIDGLNITVKSTFNENGLNVDKDGNDIEPVTFETVTDSEKIIEAIRGFVNDYNEMITELKGAYSTLPAQQTNGSRYEPLTAEQEEKYTENELAAYNEKAKQGILFGDTTLSGMYNKLLGAIAPGGADGQTLREIGIGTSYENGLTTISLDEDKLRAALENDPDKVRSAFTKTREDGSSSNGLMQNLQNTMNIYVKTIGEPKGVLINKAGSVKAPTSLTNNSLNTQMSNIDKQIERWQNKMASQIDRYTTQFTKLEQLIAEMNSQSSTLFGLMGGYESY